MPTLLARCVVFSEDSLIKLLYIEREIISQCHDYPHNPHSVVPSTSFSFSYSWLNNAINFLYAYIRGVLYSSFAISIQSEYNTTIRPLQYSYQTSALLAIAISSTFPKTLQCALFTFSLSGPVEVDMPPCPTRSALCSPMCLSN